MRVLIGYSACPLTRAAFEARGHETWTCDLLPARDGSARHLQCDIWEVCQDPGWHLGVFHPMCTYLTVSAAWAFGDGPYHQKVKAETLVGADRRAAREDAIENFKRLDALPYPHAIENPAPSFISKAHRAPDQTIQPYQFGDDASKRTGLWLSGLPKLAPTFRKPGRIVTYNGKQVERWANQTNGGQNRLSPGAERWLERSATYPGIANAMGDQWGSARPLDLVSLMEITP
ncbi:MAG: hypothetical protein PF483_11685 [Halothiobacillus sp.]|jgi:hypothetical protein|nr:hypothetical protein [Halothiobacillus sp.]